MSDEAAFLRAIVADPDDDTVRLAYSDWCAENGEGERAELIRLQIARAGDVDSWGDVKPSAREQQLLKRHAERWFAPPPGWKVEDHYHVRRGFPWAVLGNPHKLREYHETVAQWPVVRLNGGDLVRRPESERRLDELPLLARIRELSLYHSHVGAAAVRSLVSAPPFTNLLWLNVASCRLGDDGALLFAREPVLPRLRHLDLNNNSITPEGIRALIESEHRGAVESLVLANNRVTADDACAFLDAPHWANLTDLCLWNVKVGDAGAERLAACPALARLTGLNLNNNNVTDAGVRALAESPHVCNLRTLSLSVNELTAKSADALLESQHLSNLKCLRLKHTRIQWRKQRALKERFGDGVTFGVL